ncbi:hypothetical protein Tco_1486619 [Tanacetum coccineum]
MKNPHVKEIEDKIKEGTLKLYHGTNAMTFVLERQEKELLIQNLSNKMSQTEGMVTTLKNQLAAQGGQFQSMSTQLTPPNVSLVDINPINRSADEEDGTTIFGCENDASI